MLNLSIRNKKVRVENLGQNISWTRLLQHYRGEDTSMGHVA